MNAYNQRLFNYLLFLTGFFFLIEIGFFIQCNQVYLEDYTFVTDHISIPKSVIVDILFSLFILVSVHLFFCIIAWLMSKGFIAFFSIHEKHQFKTAIIIWLLLLCFILSANQYYYPNSKFAQLTSLLMLNANVSKYVFYFFLIMIVIPVTTGIQRVLCAMNKRLWIPVVTGMTIIFYAYNTYQFKYLSSATSEKPNIILIGVDSLRPDFINWLGSDYSTPFMDQFLSQSVYFTEAITPLARTFPAWMSILTGQYPQEINIRTNLMNLHNQSFPESLPAILKTHGYETIYASDESRFSNIDKRMGFNQIVTPPIGFSDFLIGSLNDSPLTNLIVNSFLGQVLMPYNYANRAAYYHYNPDTFINRLSRTILKSHQQPLFLAVHFCLPHYPYLYAGLNGENLTPQERYVASIERVDQQLKQIYQLLKASDLLTHSIVVLLSDHGEALSLSRDRITEEQFYLPKGNTPPLFYPPNIENEAMNRSVGHGTDVLGLTQYHSLLAFQLHGVKNIQLKPHIVQGVVSLIDVKPTLLFLLNSHSGLQSGISLASAFNDLQYQPPLRHLMLESDFSPNAIRTIYPEIRKVMLEGIDLFEINQKTTRLTVKESMLSKIIKTKQYADIYGEWMLASYPKNKNERILILINLETGFWTDNLNSPFAMSTPAKTMLTHLHQFYGLEMK